MFKKRGFRLGRGLAGIRFSFSGSCENPSPLRVGWIFAKGKKTESGGFEPPVILRRQRFSRPPHSTTLPTLPKETPITVHRDSIYLYQKTAQNATEYCEDVTAKKTDGAVTTGIKPAFCRRKRAAYQSPKTGKSSGSISSAGSTSSGIFSFRGSDTGLFSFRS